MKRGLVIGKFMPLHRGHIALIEFAAKQCDELIVSMTFTNNDPIDPASRFLWLEETFRNNPTIKPSSTFDDFDDESLDIKKRTVIWANFISARFPKIDVLISSEEYGNPFAEALNVPHILFDLPRNKFPISATLIRKNPFAYWDFIPPVVRPFFVKKICFFGPESTGKSFMAKTLAGLYQTEFVPEVSREILTSNDFSIQDIIRIGIAQTERVLEKTKTANKLLFCDTDVITTQLYSRIYLNEVPAILYELERKIHYDQYFLFDIDVPWVADGIRDLGDKREEMYEIFKNELIAKNIPFIPVQGTWERRTSIIKETLEKLFF